MAIKTDIRKALAEAIIEGMGCGEEEITDHASLTDDLGMDSLDQIELVMTLEEKLDIEIPDEDTEDLKTVGQVAAYLEQRVK